MSNEIIIHIHGQILLVKLFGIFLKHKNNIYYHELEPAIPIKYIVDITNRKYNKLSG
jgi:hypothetical protein